jgi:hypothetical protein
LIQDKGNSDLFIKRCPSNDYDTICEITLQEIKDRYANKTPKVNDLFLFSDHVGDKDIIKFYHDA